MRVMRHWNRLFRATMDALFLEVFTARLGGAVSSMVSLKVCPAHVVRLELDDHLHPSLPNHSVVPRIL